LTGVNAGGWGRAARPDPAQRVADGERRDPGRGRDLPQRLPGGVQPAIRAASPGVSFDAPFGPRRAGTSPATPPEATA
jgi:hypothetical protein